MGKNQSSQAISEDDQKNVIDGEKETKKVQGSINASQVKVTGCGLQHGIITEYKGRFSVDTSGAGPGSLSVKVFGPKGGFKVETFREHDWDRTISCRYDPMESGVYDIHVTWSDIHVPGSPYKVYVAETQKILQKMIKNKK